MGVNIQKVSITSQGSRKLRTNNRQYALKLFANIYSRDKSIRRPVCGSCTRLQIWVTVSSFGMDP